MEQEKKLKLIGLIINILIIAPTLLFGILVMAAGINAESATADIEAFKDSLSFNGVFSISFIALIGCAALVILFFVLSLITRPVAAIKSILGIIIAALFFYVCYLIGTSDSAESLKIAGSISTDQSTINFAHAGIITALVAISIAALLALGMGLIMKLIRK